MSRRASAASSLVLLVAFSRCGGSGSASPTPAGPRTETFSGTAQIAPNGACIGPGHAFTTGQGDLAITLVRSTGTNTVAVQVCHPTAVNHDTECTVPPFRSIGVGMTLGATVKGGRDQVLTVYPRDCRIPVAVPATTDYTVSVTHPGS